MLETCLIGYFGYAWLCKPKVIPSTCRKLLQAKNQLHRPGFSGDIAKICKLFICDTLGKPGYAHPKW